MDKLISTVTFSRKRSDLLIFLMDGPKTLEEIRVSLNVTSSGMLPQIRKLEERRLVKQEGRTYALTDTGAIVAEVFRSFIMTTEIIEKYADFWATHDIQAIPWHMLKRVSELGECNLTEYKLSEIHEPHREFIDNILKSRSIRGISPIFHPSYPQLFNHLAQGGAEISLIVTRDVYNKIKNEHREILEKFLDIKAAELYVCGDDIRLACAITENYFNISLFFKDGIYDSQCDLESVDKSAIQWGEDLFSHFLKKSKKVKAL